MVIHTCMMHHILNILQQKDKCDWCYVQNGRLSVMPAMYSDTSVDVRYKRDIVWSYSTAQ
jgi:hypothetical protein